MHCSQQVLPVFTEYTVLKSISNTHHVHLDQLLLNHIWKKCFFTITIYPHPNPLEALPNISQYANMHEVKTDESSHNPSNYSPNTKLLTHSHNFEKSQTSSHSFLLVYNNQKGTPQINAPTQTPQIAKNLLSLSLHCDDEQEKYICVYMCIKIYWLLFFGICTTFDILFSNPKGPHNNGNPYLTVKMLYFTRPNSCQKILH